MPRIRYIAVGLALGALALAPILLTASDNSEATFPGATNGKIAYSYYDGSDFHITVANPDGSGQDDLTASPFFDAAPSWSQDGTKIVFNRGSGGIDNIWTMDANGNNQVQVPGAGVIGVFPSFSPDGNTIYFITPDNNLAKVSSSKVLSQVALSQTEPCPDIGATVQVAS
jgi:Tol biopolymer transport system component